MEIEKTPERTDAELQQHLSALLQQLDECQIKLMQLNREEQVRKAQETSLQKQAYDLNERLTAEQRKLDDVQRQVEAHVEDFIHKIDRALGKNKYKFEINGDVAEKLRRKRRIYDERRRKYFHLKGELEALKLYKEYQDCVVDEIHKINVSREK